MGSEISDAVSVTTTETETDPSSDYCDGDDAARLVNGNTETGGPSIQDWCAELWLRS